MKSKRIHLVSLFLIFSLLGVIRLWVTKQYVINSVMPIAHLNIDVIPSLSSELSFLGYDAKPDKADAFLCIKKLNDHDVKITMVFQKINEDVLYLSLTYRYSRNCFVSDNTIASAVSEELERIQQKIPYWVSPDITQESDF